MSDTPKTRLFLADVHRRSEGHYSAEASELRWPPGRWPGSVSIEQVNLTYTAADKDADGDIRAFHFHNSIHSVHLTVFND